MDGANLKSPQEPRIWKSDYPEDQARKEIVNEMIDLFVKNKMTYDECYIALEDTNRTLQHRSRFVGV